LALAALPAVFNMAQLCARPLLRSTAPQNADAILILGHRPQNGALTAQGRARLDHGIALYRAGIAQRLIVSGGNTVPHVNEADLMRRYLLDASLNDSTILRERRSLDTYQNMRYSATLADSLDLHRIHIVTSPYHTLRSSCVAELLLAAHSISYGNDPTLSPAYFNQWKSLYHIGREYAALFYYGLRDPELRSCWQRLYDGS
jgi:uncharacterized SAM-binding protein YcdF (DUF218 family)